MYEGGGFSLGCALSQILFFFFIYNFYTANCYLVSFLRSLLAD